MSSPEREPIAIIGMGCRYPGAPGLAQFWDLLIEGRDAVKEVPPERWDVNAYYHPDQNAAGKIKARCGGFLDEVDRFDAAFFGISPREAPHVDPRQRLMLEVAWETLEDAGIPPEQLAGSRTGVYIATLTNDYDQLISRDLTRFQIYTGIGTANSIVANRVSYFFDLRGPSLAVDTACSGSLVAIHLACLGLRAGETEMALAGGVSLNLLPSGDVFFSRAGSLAPDGRSKPFDASANGMVRGEGAGLVALKRLSRALTDGDRIHAVIRASAVNQDGRSNGIMAPNGAAQEALLREAYAKAGISPAEVQYVETHGTGTPLGDPIEAGSLAAVLGQERPRDFACVLGSVKSNLGHPEAAAGVAGVIKTALALERGVIPPNLHFRELNPMLRDLDFPLRIYTQPGPWPAARRRRVAGVSGFGFGGTNAHVVLEEAPPAETARIAGGESCVLPISARSPEALRACAARYREFLAGAEGRGFHFPEICRAASLQRTHHDYRLTVAARTAEQAGAQLAAFADAGEVAATTRWGGPAPVERPKLVFVFSGQGAHWLGMGSQLCSAEPVFREALEDCSRRLAAHTGWPLTDRLGAQASEALWQRMDVAQPIIFAFQVGLAALWRSWGVTPDAIIGQSLGEVAAAYVAGALNLEDAARVVYERSRLLQTRAGLGRTAVVGLAHEAAERAIQGYESRLAVAGSTGPASSVISGDPDALEEVLASLEQRGVFCRLLGNVDVAAHSPQMDAVVEELARRLADIRPRGTSIPFFSTVAGRVTAGEALDAAYWARNLREPFRFAQGVERLAESGHSVFLEISPHAVLAGAIRQGLASLGVAGEALPSLEREADEQATLLGSLGALYVLGYPVDWKRRYPRGGPHVPLPTYPWQRERYWFDQLPGSAAGSREGVRPLLGEHLASAARPGEHFWELDLNARTVHYLEDHRLGETVLLPGAAFVEMALAASGEVAGGRACVLERLEFIRPLGLGAGEQHRVQVVASPVSAGEISIRIYSRPANSEAAVLHASGAVVFVAAREERRATGCASGGAERIEAEAHYQAMERRGICYGPAFRVVREVRRTDGEAWGRVELPASAASEVKAYQLHPLLLDGAFQVVAATLPPGESSTYVPRAVGRLEIFARPEACISVHARLTGGSQPGEATLEADLEMINGSGQVAAAVTGLRLQRVDAAQADGSRTARAILYEPRWREQPLDRDGAPEGEPRTWILLADSQGVGERLAARLERLGHRTLATRESANVAGLLREAAHGDMPAVAGIVHLRALDSAPAEETSAASLAAELSRGWESVTQVVRGLAEAVAGVYPRLWMVTRKAQAVERTGERLQVSAAPYWGLGRVVALEHAEFWGGLVDLGGADPERDAELLCAEILRAGDPDEIAYRGGRRYALRLSRAEDPGPGEVPLLFRPEASYIITGGLIGLGLETARWMAQRGARRLILLGRTPLPPRAAWKHMPPGHPAASRVAAIRELERLGAHVQAAAVDVGDEGQLAEFLAQYESEGWPEIRGIVHSAGLIRDQLLLRMDRATFEAVVRPKVFGSWALHTLTRHLPLDFFVLYSSMTGLLGHFGQANYACGNTFADALAHHRRACGLPALVINWGPWSQVGILARETTGADATLRAVRRIEPALGLEALEHLLRGGYTQAAVFDADWGAMQPTPLLSELTAPAQQTSSSGEAGDAALLRLMLADAGERLAAAEEWLREEAARVLRYDPARLSANKTLSAMGMDSLMAVELRNRIQSKLHLKVSLIDLFTCSPAQLAARLSAQLAPAGQLEGALAKVEQLSDAEAQALLAAASRAAGAD
ncbi:MAG TPA: type I polyketide synthase [Bryobacteraceae bacterium]|nr:type I polyketide synthase [Bryobacteraceae bacterium]